MPQHPSPDPRAETAGDPLAAALRADEFDRPRAEFKESLRADLVSRPPVSTVPATRVPNRLVWFAVAAIALIAVIGLVRTESWPDVLSRGGSNEPPGVPVDATTSDIEPTAIAQSTDPAVAAASPTIVVDGSDARLVTTAAPLEATPVPVVVMSTATSSPASLPVTHTPGPPVVVPAKATAKPETPRPSTASPTATESDLPPGTPGPPFTATAAPATASATAPATATDDGSPVLPATATAAPTSVGFPTVIVSATPSTSQGATGISQANFFGPGGVRSSSARY